MLVGSDKVGNVCVQGAHHADREERICLHTAVRCVLLLLCVSPKQKVEPAHGNRAYHHTACM